MDTPEESGPPVGGLDATADAPVGLIIPPLGWRRTAQWAAALKAWWAKHGTNIIEAAKDAASMMQPLLLPPPTESTEPPPSTTPPNTIPAPTTPPP